MNTWKRLARAVDEAEECFDAGELERACAILDEALERVDVEPFASDELDSWIDALRLRAELHAEFEEDDEAFACLDRVRGFDACDLASELLRARLHVARSEVNEAATVVDGFVDVPEELACEVLQLRGELAEHAGDTALADRLFAEAHALHPEGHVIPVRLDEDEVAQFAEQVLAELPDTVRDALDNVMITLQDHPDPGPAAMGDALLGFYEGHTLMERDAAFLPDRIRLYQRNIERSGATRDEVFEQLRITLLHEIGHHLGLDEDDLDRLGLG